MFDDFQIDQILGFSMYGFDKSVSVSVKMIIFSKIMSYSENDQQYLIEFNLVYFSQKSILIDFNGF